MPTVEDFLDVLDLERFAERFTDAGFTEIAHSATADGRWMSKPGGGPRSFLVHVPVTRTAVTWPQDVQRAAEVYAAATGTTLWWIPLTDREAAYATVIVRLLARIRDGLEEGDGGWPGADTIDVLTDWFTNLGLNINATMPDEDTPDNEWERAFLAGALSPRASD